MDRRQLRAALRVLPLAAVLAGCDRGAVDHANGPSAAVTVLLRQQGGGAAAAFDAVDNLQVEVVGDGETLFSSTVPVSPTSTGIRTSIELGLPDGARAARVSVTLRRGSDGLFTGSDDIEATPGADTQATIDLSPIVAALDLTPPPLFTVFGQVEPLDGFAVFATGDPIPDGDVVWSSLDPAIVEVVNSPGSGYFARAVTDGSALLRATFDGTAATVDARVEAVVTSVEVAPSSAALAPGESVDFVATLRDAGGSIITSRAPIWSSSDEGVATVSATGSVTAIAPGSADITASQDAASGSATVLVRPPGPDVVTLPAQAPTSTGATLRALVDPRGSTTSVVFEYGSAPDLSDAVATAPSTVAGSAGPTEVTRTVSGLPVGTTVYFRAVATNATGSASGDTESFETLDPPSVPSGLSAEFIGAQTPLVELTWLDNSSNETRFEIEREQVSGPGSPGSAPATSEGSGPAAVFVPAGIVGPNVTVFRDAPPTGNLAYRVRACNDDGCSEWTRALDWTFGERPLVVTLEATSVSGSGATLPAIINPRNAPTTVVWEVALDPSFTTPPPAVYPTNPLDAGSGRIDVARSTAVTGLSAGATYYVRAVVTNYWGTTVGNVISFSTPG